jgi:hypothetical protein
MCASSVADLVELDSLLESRWEMSGFVNYMSGLRGGRITMMGVLMFLKRLSDAGDGSSVKGLLDEEPILRELTA